MTSIDPRSRLAAAVRTEAAALRARAGQRPVPSAQGQPASLQALAAQRIQALAADDPQRKHKAVRIFLEAAMLQEWGNALAQDPQFAALVDAVHQQMRADAQLATAVSHLGDLLLSA